MTTIGLTAVEAKATLDARFPTSGATDYIGYSTNGAAATPSELSTSILARTNIGATGWAAATGAEGDTAMVKANANALTSAAAAAIAAGITSSSGTITCTGHAFNNGDAVTLGNLTGGSGYTAGTVYYVVGKATNTFQLSATQGGSAITSGTNITAGVVYAHVTHAAVFSASTAGTQRTEWQALTNPRDVTLGDQLTHAVSAIQVTLT